MIPTGAAPILQARLDGKRPADMLIVSMVGRLQEVNPVILADGDDWRFLEGLPVCIFTKRGKPFRQLALEIAHTGPRWLGVWDVENQQGTDAWLQMKPESTDNKRFSLDDFTMLFWPWSSWQNRQFQGE